MKTTKNQTFKDQMRWALAKIPDPHEEFVIALTDTAEVLTTSAVHAQVEVGERWAGLWVQPRFRPADAQQAFLLRTGRLLWNGETYWLTSAAEFRKHLLTVVQTDMWRWFMQRMRDEHSSPILAKLGYGGDYAAFYNAKVTILPVAQETIALSEGVFEISAKVDYGYESSQKYTRLDSAGIHAKILELHVNDGSMLIRGKRC